MIVGGIACLIISGVDKIAVFKLYKMDTILGLVGKLCISASFSVVYIHSNEIFPTTIRNSAMGLVSFSTRIGGITAPFLARLSQVLPNMHFVIFGVMSLIGGLLNIYLPETKDAPLPENIESLILMHSSKSKHSVKSTMTKTTFQGNRYQKVPIDDMSDTSCDRT